MAILHLATGLLAWATVLVGVPWIVVLARKGRSEAEEVQELAAGVMEVATNRKELAEVVQGPRPEAIPSASSSTDAEGGEEALPAGPRNEGRRVAQIRAWRLVNRGAAPDGSALVSSSIEPWHHETVERLRSRPDGMVLLALAFTVAGLIVTLILLTSGLAARSAAGAAGLAAADSLSGMWKAFVPTLSGIIAGLRVRQVALEAVGAWERATSALDGEVAAFLANWQRRQPNVQIDRNLNEAAKALRGTAEGLQAGVGPLRGTIEGLGAAVSGLDPKQIRQAADELTKATEGLAVTASNFAPRADELRTAAQTVSEATGGLAEAATAAAGELREASGALKPLQEAAKPIQATINGLQSAAGLLGGKVDGFTQIIGEQLSPAVERLAEAHVPMAEMLKTAGSTLKDAADHLETVSASLSDAQERTNKSLDNLTAGINESTAGQQRVFQEMRSVMDNALNRQDEFQTLAVAAVHAELVQAPPVVDQLTRATEGLRSQLDSLTRSVTEMRQAMESAKEVAAAQTKPVDTLAKGVEQLTAATRTVQQAVAQSVTAKSIAQLESTMQAILEGLQNMQKQQARLAATVGERGVAQPIIEEDNVPRWFKPIQRYGGPALSVVAWTVLVIAGATVIGIGAVSGVLPPWAVSFLRHLAWN